MSRKYNSIEERLAQIEEVLVSLVQDLDETQQARRRNYDWAIDLMRNRMMDRLEAEGL